MIHAYDKNYLERARVSLGVMFDYLVNDCHIKIDNVWDSFIESNISFLFENGDSSTLAGKSGIELAKELFDVDVSPSFNDVRSREYWLGWAIAYYQWYRNIPFGKITTPILDLLELYSPYHEMDILQFCDKMDELLNINNNKSKLKQTREKVGLSQIELASLSGIPVRTIQQYEQKQKDINGARSEYLIKLANVLLCEPESLLE